MAALDVDAIRAGLRSFRALLESDLQEAMQVLDSLHNALEHSPARSALLRLESHLQSFDTDSALLRVEEIASALNITL
ncbi:MAG: hypothetical protein HC888_17500 [Candidatus Competibacteraceae bacterium]|nr:hypothetical protein [Candidatus Competibacteraceae bacterium]